MDQPFFPAIGREEKVDRSIVKIHLAGQVGGDHLPHGCAAIGEAPSLHR